MTPEQFCYWLQGFAEITSASNVPTAEQWKIINDHLQTVFKKVTPEYKPTSIEDALKRLEKDNDGGGTNWPIEKRDPWKVTCSDLPPPGAVC